MTTEVFTKKVEDIYEKPKNFNKVNTYEDNYFGEDIKDSDVKIQEKSKSLNKAKKEFFNELEDESLNMDSCNTLNKN